MCHSSDRNMRTKNANNTGRPRNIPEAPRNKHRVNPQIAQKTSDGSIQIRKAFIILLVFIVLPTVTFSVGASATYRARCGCALCLSSCDHAPTEFLFVLLPRVIGTPPLKLSQDFRPSPNGASVQTGNMFPFSGPNLINEDVGCAAQRVSSLPTSFFIVHLFGTTSLLWRGACSDVAWRSWFCVNIPRAMLLLART